MTKFDDGEARGPGCILVRGDGQECLWGNWRSCPELGDLRFCLRRGHQKCDDPWLSSPFSGVVATLFLAHHDLVVTCRCQTPMEGNLVGAWTPTVPHPEPEVPQRFARKPWASGRR
jgi:hypothetical protein